MFAVPTVPAGVSTPTVPPAGCCAHTRGEHARRFPSPRSCALTPTFLQVLATELPRPYPTPIPIARALLAAQLSLSRSTLSLNSRRTRTHTRTLPLSYLSLSTPLRPRDRPRISDRHAPLDRREARGGVRAAAVLVHRPSVFRTLVLLCPGRASHSPHPHAARCARAAALGTLYKSNNVQW